MTYRKKLIEVALPLEAINVASAKEKSIRQGHPSTLHLWWARRPLAACRAVLFASLVDDPSSRPEEFPTEEAQEVERQRLFRLIEELVKWENSTNEEVLGRARAEILRSTDGHPPLVLDPFCGGGSIPLEAQRLGLEAHASDLNPVAVLISKALIEIPPKFGGRPPVHPQTGQQQMVREWKGTQGLAEDVRFYGAWMRERAIQRIGHLFPKATLPKELGGGEASVVAWIWARTVPCPNPACRATMPLVRSFWLSTKSATKVWVSAQVDRSSRTIHFSVDSGNPNVEQSKLIGEGTGYLGANGKKVQATFRCIVCGSGPVKGEYIDQEANARRMGMLPLAIVAEGQRRRIYLPCDNTHLQMALADAPDYLRSSGLQDTVPTAPARGTFASNAQGRRYGFFTFADYFTSRQLVALTTFSDLVNDARKQVERDGVGTGAESYADAVAVYLACAVDRVAMSINSLARWNSVGAKVQHCFGRQAIPMLWDFAESNVFYTSTGSWSAAVDMTVNALESLVWVVPGHVTLDNATQATSTTRAIVSTDPPYYDNVSYADLSDFFYVWLRRPLQQIYPDLFGTLLTPKAQELVASPYRFEGEKERADAFFEQGLSQSFVNARKVQHISYPLTVFYAFKQVEAEEYELEESAGTSILVASTGWETMLTGLISSGFAVTGTWPMRTEMKTRQVAMSTNALASSIVLVCRPRPESASLASRREFVQALRRELPHALRDLQRGNIAPVDLAQAAIGPGMGVFSRYSQVLEADGSPMRVRTALALINQALDEVLAEQEGEFDEDTRWAIAWFDQYGQESGQYGVAETLSKAKNTSVSGLVDAGFLVSGKGNVRLVRREELPEDWDPSKDRRLTVWEVTQHLIRALDRQGEAGAAQLLRRVGALGETARDLAYRLYTTCERKNRASEALAYNSLVVAWPELTRLAAQAQPGEQLDLFA